MLFAAVQAQIDDYDEVEGQRGDIDEIKDEEMQLLSNFEMYQRYNGIIGCTHSEVDSCGTVTPAHFCSFPHTVRIGNLCYQPCPSFCTENETDLFCTCRGGTYDRPGVGFGTPLSCDPATEVYRAGLCYPASCPQPETSTSIAQFPTECTDLIRAESIQACNYITEELYYLEMLLLKADSLEWNCAMNLQRNLTCFDKETLATSPQAAAVQNKAFQTVTSILFEKLSICG
jgi:hypothetical protein